MNMSLLCQYSQSSLQAVIILCSLLQAKIEAFLDYYCQNVSENGTDLSPQFASYFEPYVLLLSVTATRPVVFEGCQFCWL